LGTPAHRAVGVLLGGLPPTLESLPNENLFRQEDVMLWWILLIILVVVLLAALPTWGYSSGWGYYPIRMGLLSKWPVSSPRRGHPAVTPDRRGITAEKGKPCKVVSKTVVSFASFRVGAVGDLSSDNSCRNDTRGSW
jgi:Protein of unknown function (DUF3309)